MEVQWGSGKPDSFNHADEDNNLKEGRARRQKEPGSMADCQGLKNHGSPRVFTSGSICKRENDLYPV